MVIVVSLRHSPRTAYSYSLASSLQFSKQAPSRRIMRAIYNVLFYTMDNKVLHLKALFGLVSTNIFALYFLWNGNVLSRMSRNKVL